uniref:Uncharacterized protein n=1 Tax=Poecilia reticulata TaxID=8081 RepID=A0A3P9MUB3_POERE
QTSILLFHLQLSKPGTFNFSCIYLLNSLTSLHTLNTDLNTNLCLLIMKDVVLLQDSCQQHVLCCYMLELMMVFEEEDTEPSKTQCIFNFNSTLLPEVSVCSSRLYYCHLKIFRKKNNPYCILKTLLNTTECSNTCTICVKINCRVFSISTFAVNTDYFKHI